MTSTSDPPGPVLARDSFPEGFMRSLVPYLAWGAVLGGGLFTFLGFLDGKDFVTHAMAGAAVGLVIGGQWRWRDLRAANYRAQHDPPGPTLTLESTLASLPEANELPALRRYGAPPTTAIFLLSLLALCVPLVIMGALIQEPAWAWAVVWVGVTVPLGGLLWAILFTYTEVGPDGIRLNKPFRSRLVAWTDLVEVGWARETFRDVVILSTVDGRRLKTVGIAVSATGIGRKRVLRMLDDIEQTWASAVGWQ